MTELCPPGGHCATCGDEAHAMRVLRVDEERGLALCEDEHGVRRTVEVALVAPVAAGGTVLVHAGVAIAALGEKQAVAR
jgi:hydrogenase assembly chaperone HypC/HupF